MRNIWNFIIKRYQFDFFYTITVFVIVFLWICIGIILFIILRYIIIILLIIVFIVWRFVIKIRSVRFIEFIIIRCEIIELVNQISKKSLFILRIVVIDINIISSIKRLILIIFLWLVKSFVDQLIISLIECLF